MVTILSLTLILSLILKTALARFLKFHLLRESKKYIIGKGKLLLDLHKNEQFKYFQMDSGDRVIVWIK